MLISAVQVFSEWWYIYPARMLDHYETLPTFAHTHPSNMTILSDDPDWWPLIILNIFLSYWMGSSYQLVMSRSIIDLQFRSFCRRCGGIRLGWAGQYSETADNLMIFPVLTIGQEVCRGCHWSSQLAKNGVIDWIDLGEWQSPMLEEKQHNIGQRQRWSLMTVLYLVVCTTYYAIAWLASCADSKMF
jgi:hypothetical protein